MGTALATITGFARADLASEQKVYPIPFTECKVWDAPQTNLPATPSSDDAGLVVGTPGTHALTIQGLDPGGTTTSSKFTFEFALPPEYDATGAVAIRVKGKCGTSIADNSVTIDFNVYRDAGDGTVGSDLMASSAFSINNTSVQTSDMGITSASLNPGDKLIVVGTIAGIDVANAAAIVPTLLAMAMVLSVKG